MNDIYIIQVNFRRYDLSEESLGFLYSSEGVYLKAILVDILPLKDEAERLKRKFPSLIHLPSQENRGYGAALNHGIKYSLARGAGKVLLMNNDVTVLPDTIRLLDETQEGHETGILAPLLLSGEGGERISSAGIYVNRLTGRVRHRLYGRPLSALPSPAPLISPPAVSGAMMLVLGEVFLKVGLFSTDYFMYFEDVDFCLRARRGGYRVILVPSARAHHRGGGTTGDGPEGIYFSTRNQLLMADRNLLPSRGIVPSLRRYYITLLNLSHLLFTSGRGLSEGLPHFMKGVRDYRRMRSGGAPMKGNDE